MKVETAVRIREILRLHVELMEKEYEQAERASQDAEGTKHDVEKAQEALAAWGRLRAARAVLQEFEQSDFL